MPHPLYKVTHFAIVGPYTLKVGFDDNTEQVINFEPVLYGYYFGPLRDPALFAQVAIDPNFHTLVWPNDADFDPATLHDWNHSAGAELAERARRWTSVESIAPAR
jgi:hypothetical protein